MGLVEEEKVKCLFCAHGCELSPGQTGVCGVRRNFGGRIKSLYYQKLAAYGIDPVEKKPLYHFYPGEAVISIASYGCNFKCSFCQNHSISLDYDQIVAENSSTFAPPKVLAEMKSNDTSLVAYTYTEPSVWQDYMLKCAESVKNTGGKNIMVTNGFFSDQSAGLFTEYIDAFNIDLKGDDIFYRKHCGGRMLPVLNSIAKVVESGRHIEVTTLLIEGLHTIDMIKELGKLLLDAGVSVWHISRFHPAYKMINRNRTSEAFLSEAVEAAVELGIPFVYGGNSMRYYSSSTKCSNCSTMLIQRDGYSVKTINSRVENHKLICGVCGTEMYGEFKS